MGIPTKMKLAYCAQCNVPVSAAENYGKSIPKHMSPKDRGVFHESTVLEFDVTDETMLKPGEKPGDYLARLMKLLVK